MSFSYLYQLISSYLWNRKAYTILGIYVVIGAILRIFFHIDIFPPCLWSTLFGIECPGCGLTRAFLSLCVCNFKAAYNYNPFIYIVAPTAIYFTWSDFFSFKKTFVPKD